MDRDNLVVRIAGEPVAEPNHWPHRRYRVSLTRTALHDTQVQPPPVNGDVIETRPGAVWRVLGVITMVTTAETEEPAYYELILEPIKPHSIEAHGLVRPLRGGTLR